MKKIIIYVFFLGLIAASCSRNKAVVKEKTISNLEVDSVYNAMNANQFEAEWFSGKFKGAYHRPDDKQLFSGQIRIRKDSLIWVSVTAIMNIEVFRIEIKPDSFTFINRLEKTYIKSSTEFLRERIGVDVDFEMLQAVILGNDFPYYETDVFKLNNRSNNYLLSTVSRRKIIKKVNNKNSSSRVLVQNIFIDKQTYRINKQVVKVVGEDKTKLRINYGDFQDIDGQLFPNNMIIKFKEDNKTFIEFNFYKVVVNEKLRFPFKVSKKYEEAKIEDRK